MVIQEETWGVVVARILTCEAAGKKSPLQASGTCSEALCVA